MFIEVYSNAKHFLKYSCPHLKIETSKGISADAVAKLDEELKDFCKKAIGEVMMLEVAQFIQVWFL